MIAKSLKEGKYVANMRKLFKKLRKYQLKLNLAKCIFDVTSDKLLGSIMSKNGIKIDLDKVKAIQNLALA